MSSINDASAEIVELARFVNVAWHGLAYSAVARDIEQSTAKILGRDTNENSDEERKRVERLIDIEQFSQAQEQRGFPYLYGLAAIRVWSILETMVQDTVCECLVEHESARNSDSLRKLKGPLIEFAMASPSLQAEFLVSQLASDLGSKFKKGVGRFESLLGAIGLGGAVHELVARYLFELSELRNVIVHRNSVADVRVVNACAWLGLNVGDRISVTKKQFQAYSLAARWYMCELALRENLIYSPDPAATPGVKHLSDVKEQLLKDLQNCAT